MGITYKSACSSSKIPIGVPDVHHQNLCNLHVTITSGNEVSAINFSDNAKLHSMYSTALLSEKEVPRTVAKIHK